MITIYNRETHECINVEFQDQHSSIKVHFHKHPYDPPILRQIKIVGDTTGVVFGEDVVSNDDREECDILS